MADMAFLEAKIVCGGAWGNDKMVCGFMGRWWEGAVAHIGVWIGRGEVVERRCSALLVLGLGREEGKM